MEIDKREQEQRDWTGYGSAERPIVVTYYHVELAEHDVLYVEGMTCESYLATGDVAVVNNNGRAVALQPKFAPAAIWEKAPGAAFVARHGMSADGYQQEFNTLLGQGYRLKLVSGY